MDVLNGHRQLPGVWSSLSQDATLFCDQCFYVVWISLYITTPNVRVGQHIPLSIDRPPQDHHWHHFWTVDSSLDRFNTRLSTPVPNRPDLTVWIDHSLMMNSKTPYAYLSALVESYQTFQSIALLSHFPIRVQWLRSLSEHPVKWI